jgi:hypothetical protein
LFVLLKPNKISKKQEEIIEQKEGIYPYINPYYILFFVSMVLSSITFANYFSVMPLYWQKEHFLSTDSIGWLMFVNGANIVVFEMPLVAFLEKIQIKKKWLFFGVVFFRTQLFGGESNRLDRYFNCWNDLNDPR